MTDLGTLTDYFPGFGIASNYATGINDRGQIVGYCTNAASSIRAFLVDPDAGMVFLGNLMADPRQRWTPLEPSAINNRGDIAGKRRIYDPPYTWYDARAFLLTSALSIQMDIKPGDFPNHVNPKSQGALPVAALTTGDFDATTIDSNTVLLASVPPIRWCIEDVDGDQDLDMLFHFKTSDLALEGQTGIVTLTLTGRTKDGLSFQGRDEVLIVGK